MEILENAQFPADIAADAVSAGLRSYRFHGCCSLHNHWFGAYYLLLLSRATVSIPIITKGIRLFQKRFLPKIAEEKFGKNAGWIIPTRQ